MSYELIYTSAERGLKSGSRGFATVAMTEGMPAHCMQLCESMSGYVHVFELNSEQYVINPVAWSHYRVKCGSTWYSLFSRVSAHAKDYTGRTNKIAHHLMLEQPQETFGYANGPSDLMDSSFFESTWQGDARFLPAGRQPESMRFDADPQAKHWLAAGLSAETAARMAGALAQDTDAPMVLLFDPQNQQANLTGLIQDLLELLPPERRWKIGFSTYYSMHPSGSEVHLRACAKGTDAARKVARHPRAVVVDVDAGTVKGLEHLPEADATLVQAAQSGSLPAWAQAAKEVVSLPDPVVSPRAAVSESKTSLPPLRSDRPGIRSDRPRPPSSRTAKAKVTKKQKSILPVLLGVGVGILILLLFAGQKMISGLSKPDEGDVAELSTPLPTPAKTPEEKPTSAGTTATINPTPELKTAGTTVVMTKEKTSQEVTEETVDNVDPADKEKVGDASAEDELSEVDIVPKNTNQSSENDTPNLIPFDSFSEIPISIRSDAVSFGKKGDKIKVAGEVTRSGGTSNNSITDDNKVIIYKAESAKIQVYYKSKSFLEIEAEYKSDGIALNSELIKMLYKIQAEIYWENRDENKGDLNVKGSSLVFEGLNKILMQEEASFDNEHSKTLETLELKIDGYITALEKVKDKEKEPLDFKNEKEYKKFQTAQNDAVTAVFKEAFLVKTVNSNPMAEAFSPVQNDPKSKLFVLVKALENNEGSKFRSPTKSIGFQNDISTEFKNTYENGRRITWINAAIEAIQMGKLRILEEMENTFPKFTTSHVILIRPKKHTDDILMKIQISVNKK